jgi:hypothetical protein
MVSRNADGIISNHLFRAVVAAVLVAAWTLHAQVRPGDPVPSEHRVGAEGAGRLFVDAERGDDNNDGLTPETALASIQEGIDRSKNGDTVTVQPGWYAGDIDFLGKDIVLTGINPSDSLVTRATVIAGIVRFRGNETPACTLTRFKINGSIIGSDPLADPAERKHTRATISHCILENIWTGCGGVIQDCDGAISNCIVANISYRCKRAWPVPAITGCHGSITNCTIVNATDGIEIREGGTCTIENSILYGGTPIIIRENATAHVSYSNVEGGLESVFGAGTANWGPGNIDADPCFVELGGEDTPGDYHLRSQAGRWDATAHAWVHDPVTSSCLDAGNPNSDEGAELWPHGQRVNMGAHGGTPEASLSLSPLGSALVRDETGTVATERLFALVNVWLAEGLLSLDDLNHDGFVDFSDFTEAAVMWDNPGAPVEEPFEIVLGKKAQWPKGQEGYDPNLPGYHLVGDIASVTLRARTAEPPDKLVLVIRNWPSATPMLENFTLTCPLLKLSGEPFNTGQFEHFQRSTPQAKWEFVSLVPVEEYCIFEIAGDEIHVTFLPRAIELLSDECEVSWIDWYRR